MSCRPPSPSILVVENERIVAFNLQQRLLHLGYRVSGVAASGEEALAMVEKTRPDLVLMDIRIDGDIDGIETATRLSETNTVPVIYLTAHAEMPTLERARMTRPHGYLIKPFSELELHATIQMALERRSFDIKLKESEVRFRGALDVMLEGCQIIGFDWKYIYLNDSALQHNRHTRDEMLGKTLQEVFPNIESTDVFAALRRCMADRTEQGLQTLYEYDDGGYAWFDISVQPVPEGIFVLSIDITSQKLAEERLRQLNEQLEARVMQRTAALTAANMELEAFGYSVSHDLRAPLRHLDGYARLALEGSESLDGNTRSYLSKIVSSSKKMGNLIDDLLVLSRAGRAELNTRPIELSTLINEVKQECMTYAGEREIAWEIDELPRVQGDLVLLWQVFFNLISNAVKFTRKREHAVIEVHGRSIANGEVEISIRDNGAGFDMRYYAKLFNVFQRLHREDEFEGTGVGLAIVQRVVVRHGGRVWGEGAPGEGARFHFSLPMEG